MAPPTKDELRDYFIEHTNERLRIIDEKLDKLIQFKWQIIGGAGVLSLFVTLCIQVITIILNHYLTNGG